MGTKNVMYIDYTYSSASGKHRFHIYSNGNCHTFQSKKIENIIKYVVGFIKGKKSEAIYVDNHGYVELLIEELYNENIDYRIMDIHWWDVDTIIDR